MLHASKVTPPGAAAATPQPYQPRLDDRTLINEEGPVRVCKFTGLNSHADDPTGLNKKVYWFRYAATELSQGKLVPSGRESFLASDVLRAFYKNRAKEDVYNDIKNNPHLKKQFDEHTKDTIQLMREVSACIVQMSMSSFGGMCVCVFAGLLAFLFVCDSLSVCWPVCTACLRICSLSFCGRSSLPACLHVTWHLANTHQACITRIILSTNFMPATP
jgi:hypothetical protein